MDTVDRARICRWCGTWLLPAQPHEDDKCKLERQIQINARGRDAAKRALAAARSRIDH